jgi:hypothetical protein
MMSGSMHFDCERSAIIGKAFDCAWDMFLRAGALTPQNLDTSRVLIAQRIIELARDGEVSQRRLIIGALRSAPVREMIKHHGRVRRRARK